MAATTGWVFSKVNTSLKIQNTKTNFEMMTNLQVLCKYVDSQHFSVHTAAFGVNVDLTIPLADIVNIGGSAPGATVDAVFNQIAPLLN